MTIRNCTPTAKSTRYPTFDWQHNR